MDRGFYSVETFLLLLALKVGTAGFWSPNLVHFRPDLSASFPPLPPAPSTPSSELAAGNDRFCLAEVVREALLDLGASD